MVRNDWTFINKDELVWLRIDSVTRRVKFEYVLDSEGGYYEFELLSECRDNIQEIIQTILKREKIETITVEDNRDFYTIVTNSNLIFQK